MKKDNRFGYILRTSCLPKRVIERKIEGKRYGTRRQERRRKQLLDDLKETQGYCNLKDRTLRRTRFIRGYGLVSKTGYGMKSHIAVTTL